MRTESFREAICERTELEQTLADCRSAVATVAVFSFIINILMLATPLYMLQVMDRVLRSGSIATLVLLTLIACGAVLVMCVLDTMRHSIALRTSSWIVERLGPVFLASSVRARLRGDHSGSETLRDLDHLRSFIATHGMAAFLDAPWVPIFVVFIWFLHPYLGLVALLSAAVLFALSLANEWVTRSPTKTADEAQIVSMRLADITIRNAEVVTAMGFLPAMLARWHEVNTVVTDALRAAGETAGHVLSLTKFMRMSVQVTILGVGAWLVVDNSITPGAMIGAAILLGRALAPVEQAIGGWKNFVSARLAYQRLQEHLLAYPAEPERTLLPDPHGHLSVERLSYVVPETGHVILNDVSFDLSPGEALAIIGPSGAGKSTLCRLLVGLAEPASGMVRLDGSDLRHWQPEQLGRHIGFLPQEVELFPGTVHENIARMGPASDEVVVAAARRAHAHPIIQRLPQGYGTDIGDGGVRLSGGQRQRIGLARAVFGDPRVIVLDEPNANLDQAGESALADALRELKQEGCALIIVGHRPSTLAHADKILVLKNGMVAMFGDRDEVMEAWSEASASKGGSDAVPLRRSASPSNALTRTTDRTAEAGAS